MGGRPSSKMRIGKLLKRIVFWCLGRTVPWDLALQFKRDAFLEKGNAVFPRIWGGGGTYERQHDDVPL